MQRTEELPTLRGRRRGTDPATQARLPSLLSRRKTQSQIACPQQIALGMAMIREGAAQRQLVELKTAQGGLLCRWGVGLQAVAAASPVAQP